MVRLGLVTRLVPVTHRTVLVLFRKNSAIILYDFCNYKLDDHKLCVVSVSVVKKIVNVSDVIVGSNIQQPAPRTTRRVGPPEVTQPPPQLTRRGREVRVPRRYEE